MKPLCNARVGEPPHYFHWHECGRVATATVNGEPRCTQHKKQWERNARITGQPLQIEDVA